MDPYLPFESSVEGVKAGDSQAAENWLARMIYDGVEANEVSYATVIRVGVGLVHCLRRAQHAGKCDGHVKIAESINILQT